MRNDIEQILQFYKSGMKFKDIKDKTGCCDKVIYYNLKKHNLNKRGRIRLDYKKIASLYASGLSSGQVSKELNCSKSRIKKVARTFGITKPFIQFPVEPKKCNYCGIMKTNKDFNRGIKRCKICAKTYMAGMNNHDQIKEGYVYKHFPNHQRANSRGYVREHILVWEQSNNKKLPQTWLVHHINGIKNDNRPQNLLGIPQSKHHILIEPYRKRIRELEKEIKNLRQPSII